MTLVLIRVRLADLPIKHVQNHVSESHRYYYWLPKANTRLVTILDVNWRGKNIPNAYYPVGRPPCSLSRPKGNYATVADVRGEALKQLDYSKCLLARTSSVRYAGRPPEQGSIKIVAVL